MAQQTPSYSETYRSYPDEALQAILAQEDDFYPDAVAAARRELARRSGGPAAHPPADEGWTADMDLFARPEREAQYARRRPWILGVLAIAVLYWLLRLWLVADRPFYYWFPVTSLQQGYYVCYHLGTLLGVAVGCWWLVRWRRRGWMCLTFLFSYQVITILWAQLRVIGYGGMPDLPIALVILLTLGSGLLLLLRRGSRAAFGVSVGQAHAVLLASAGVAVAGELLLRYLLLS